MTLSDLRTYRAYFFGGIKAILFTLILVLLVLILLQVFTRYVLQAGVPWTEEVARMVIVWAVMLGAAVAMDRNEHYAITVLSDLCSAGTRRWLLVITNVVGFIFLAAMVRYGGEYTAANLHTTYVSTHVSRAWMYLALPVGAGIMAISLAVHSVEVWFMRKEVPPNSSAPLLTRE